VEVPIIRLKTYSVGPIFLMLDEVHELNYSQYYMSLPETYTIVKQDNTLYGTTICMQAALTICVQAFVDIASGDVLICVCMLDT
jgi:hypothetical protein